MADCDIMCNFKKCRKPLKKTAWVTSCSHIFCEEDGLKELRNSADCKCPVCGSHLSHSADIVRADLNPSEHFKAMVLTGLSPEIIIDIVNRAFAFWAYQSNLTRKHQEGMISSYKEKLCMLENSYETLISKIRQETALLKKKVDDLEKERNVMQTRLDESVQKLAEKTRENQKLHHTCNTIRKANLNTLADSGASNGEDYYSLGLQTMDTVVRNVPLTPRQVPMHVSATAVRRKVPDQAGFRFKPVTPRTSANPRDTGQPDFSSFMVPKNPRTDN